MIAFAWDEQGEPVNFSEFSTGARSLARSLSLLLSSFLLQVWSKHWERAGLEMEG